MKTRRGTQTLSRKTTHRRARLDNALLTNPNITEEWIRNALIYLPNHPSLHIALAGYETDSRRADFLRSFGLARLPKSSAVCRRAGEMLLAQQQPRLALAAVDSAAANIVRRLSKKDGATFEAMRGLRKTSKSSCFVTMPLSRPSYLSSQRTTIADHDDSMSAALTKTLVSTTSLIRGVAARRRVLRDDSEGLFRNLLVSDASGSTLLQSTLTDPSILDAFTTNTNTETTLMDGSKRDRLVWSGDLTVSTPTLYYSSGASDAVAGSLRLHGSYQRSSGQVPGNLPPQLRPGLAPGDAMPDTYYYSLSYSIYFVTTLYQYYLYTGDKDLVRWA
jgi:Bacterial alpha-L-rhamnosidase 6 hairpin glycosidase domain